MNYLALAVLGLASVHAMAEEREWVAYSKLVDTTYLEKFYASPLAQRDKVIMYVTISPNNKNIKPQDVVLTVVHAGGRVPMQVSAERKLFVNYNPAWVKEGAMIHINQPKGEKMGIGFGLDALIPEGKEWRYAMLMGSVKQSNELIKLQAGMMSMFVPKIKFVTMKFAKPAQLTIAAKDGAKTLSTDAKNTIRLAPDAALLQENPTITVSERPLVAELDNE